MRFVRWINQDDILNPRLGNDAANPINQIAMGIEHGDTFTIPPGGQRILTGAYCANQAYVVEDKHLGMQCHVEMTPEMIASWIRSGAGEVKESLASPAVQPVEKIQEEMPRKLPDLSATAERLYRRWVKGLKA